MDGYEEIKYLGKGGFGEVKLVRDKYNDQTYALKVINIANEEDAKQVEHEKDCYRRLDHPHIVAYKNHFMLSPHEYCIVMEYCSGGTLTDKIDNQKELNRGFSEEQILMWCRDVTEAVVYIQSPPRRIIHRDIKPDNVLLAKDGTVKLADFGIVRMGGDVTAYIQKTLTMKGTMFYLPPECYGPNPEENTRDNFKWDVWAVGCTMHELATLKLTFQGNGIFEMMRCIREQPHPPQPTQYKYIGPIVDQLLQKSVANRSDAKSALKRMEEALETIRSSKPTRRSSLDTELGAVGGAIANLAIRPKQQGAVANLQLLKEELAEARKRNKPLADLIQEEIIPKTGDISTQTQLAVYSVKWGNTNRDGLIRYLVFTVRVSDLLSPTLQTGDRVLHIGWPWCVLCSLVSRSGGHNIIQRDTGTDVKEAMDRVKSQCPPYVVERTRGVVHHHSSPYRTEAPYRAIVLGYTQDLGWDPAPYESLLHTGGHLIYTAGFFIYGCYTKSPTGRLQKTDWTAEWDCS